MRRRVGWRTRAALGTAGLALLLAAPASGAGLETIVQDDASFLHRSSGEVVSGMARLRSLGADRVRLTADWAELTRDPTAARAPAFDARNPAAYEDERWRVLDRAVRAARDAGLAVLVDVGFWAPRWATDSPPGPRARSRIDPAAYAAFVQATLRRYDGRFVPARDAGPDGPGALPRVSRFALWNEPNHPALLLPQWNGTGRGARPASPGVYRRMLAAAIPAARRVRPDAELLIGNTSSSAGRPGSGAVPPLRFLRELACVDRQLRPLRTAACRSYVPVGGDGFAHHPYSRNRRPDLRAARDRPDDVGIADLGKLSGLLDALADRGRIAPGLRRVHITEFGYETVPVRGRPDLTEAQQARWLTWAERIADATPGVVSFAQFLLRDQPPAAVKVSDSPSRPFGQFGTGLDRGDGTPKLAAAAFLAGLHARAAGPGAASLWVRLRLRGQRRRVAIEELRDGEWRPVRTWTARGSAPGTPDFAMDARGTAVRMVARRPGSRFRLAVGSPEDLRGIDVGVSGPPPPRP